jgi:hypothetical protein
VRCHRTSWTMWRMCLKAFCLLPSSLHAAPMQKRVLPGSLARHAASTTSCTFTCGVGFTQYGGGPALAPGGTLHTKRQREVHLKVRPDQRCGEAGVHRRKGLLDGPPGQNGQPSRFRRTDLVRHAALAHAALARAASAGHPADLAGDPPAGRSVAQKAPSLHSPGQRPRRRHLLTSRKAAREALRSSQHTLSTEVAAIFSPALLSRCLCHAPGGMKAFAGHVASAAQVSARSQSPTAARHSLPAGHSPTGHKGGTTRQSVTTQSAG